MAAGLGFKDFTTGEVLTAADVDGYLMQGVWVFASAAARDAAVTSPQEGNFAYLKDTNVTTYYTGSAWANLDTTGMTNPMTTTGDTIYSSSGSTPARLGIGSTGNVLTVSGGVPVWAAPAGGGSLNIVTPTSTANSGGSVSTTGGAVTFTGVTSVSLNGVFTSTYANYLIVLSELTASQNIGVNLRFRVSGTDSSTGYYAGGFYVLYSSSTVNGEASSNGTSVDVSGSNTTPTVGSIMYLQNPQLAKTTAYQLNMTRHDAGGYRTGYHSVTTAYDGFTLIASAGNVTGVVRVYGLSN
jgi:hypothetical protein